MPPSPSQWADEPRNEKAHTLAELLCAFPTPEMRRELEEFRIRYEAEFGETDLSLRYTSTWPAEQQQWLLDHHPKRYWDGLPPFVQAFVKSKMRCAASRGRLDDQPAEFLRLFLNGQMTIRDNDHHR